MSYTRPLAALAAVAATAGLLMAANHDDQSHATTPTHHTRTDVHVCARAAFLADDYAHTHTGARAERHAVAACAATVGGF